MANWVWFLSVPKELLLSPTAIDDRFGDMDELHDRDEQGMVDFKSSVEQLGKYIDGAWEEGTVDFDLPDDGEVAQKVHAIIPKRGHYRVLEEESIRDLKELPPLTTRDPYQNAIDFARDGNSSEEAKGAVLDIFACLQQQSPTKALNHSSMLILQTAQQALTECPEDRRIVITSG